MVDGGAGLQWLPKRVQGHGTVYRVGRLSSESIDSCLVWEKASLRLGLLEMALVIGN